MEIIGFIASMLLGIALVAGSLGSMWLSRAFAGIHRTKEVVICTAISLVGFAIIWWAIANAPFRIISA